MQKLLDICPVLRGEKDVGLRSSFKKSSKGLTFLYALLEIRDNQILR